MSKLDVGWLDKAIDKLSKGHVFVITLVIVFLMGGMQIFGEYYRSTSESATATKLTELMMGMDDISDNLSVTNNVLKEVSWNLMLLRNGNNNNLTLSSARDISHTILDASKMKIKNDICDIIDKNHIDDSLRQKLITISLNSKINGYYTMDYNAVARLYYKNKQLSDIWLNFDIKNLTDVLLQMMFDPVYINNHTLLKSDIQEFIDSAFDSYYFIVDTNLDSRY